VNAAAARQRERIARDPAGGLNIAPHNKLISLAE
jgi:hypothetical protein